MISITYFADMKGDALFGLEPDAWHTGMNDICSKEVYSGSPSALLRTDAAKATPLRQCVG